MAEDPRRRSVEFGEIQTPDTFNIDKSISSVKEMRSTGCSNCRMSEEDTVNICFLSCRENWSWYVMLKSLMNKNASYVIFLNSVFWQVTEAAQGRSHFQLTWHKRTKINPYLASFFMDSVYYIFDFICIRLGRVGVVCSVFASVHIWTRSL